MTPPDAKKKVRDAVARAVAQHSRCIGISLEEFVVDNVAPLLTEAHRLGMEEAAEDLKAAKRMAKDYKKAAEASFNDLSIEMTKLKADNAALVARVKELEEAPLNLQGLLDTQKNQTKLLKVVEAARNHDKALCELGIDPGAISETAQILHDALSAYEQKEGT